MNHTVVPIQFTKVGKKYYFAKNNIEVEYQDFVIVETSRGLEVGIVADDVKEITEEEVVQDLKPILRLATDEDLKQYEDNKEVAPFALDICKKAIKDLSLEMKLLGAEYTLDRSKIIFTYTSDGRVDFRQLLVELAKKIKTRIELKQVGERDGAKQLGGIGLCGRELCCSKHLTNFDTVSIKMAKNQNLSLNPQKITGVCGKLLCCIAYENDTYTDLKKGLPKKGDHVNTPCCSGCKVIDVDVIRQAIKVDEEGKQVEYNVTELNGSN